jgi:protein-L-isoaspartate(D-aspartate) O-methyltransferase
LIIVAAAPPRVPPALIEQLASGGRLILPVGESYQELTVVEKTADGQLRYTQIAPVMFVPMTEPEG